MYFIYVIIQSKNTVHSKYTIIIIIIVIIIAVVVIICSSYDILSCEPAHKFGKDKNDKSNTPF